MLRTIVAAVDASPGSRAALHQAARLAAQAGATLHVVHADAYMQSSGVSDPSEVPPSPTLRLETERFAEDELAPLEPADRPDDVRIAVVRGVSTPVALLEYVTRVSADLLVMGTHGRRGVGRLLLGSVAEACVAEAPCPVLTLPERAADTLPSPEAPVLVAVDFSGRSREAIEVGQGLAALYGAPLELVHVVQNAGPYPAVGRDVLAVAGAPPRWKAEAQERLEHVAGQMTGTAPGALHAVLGSSATALTQLAAERGAGAIVVGTRGRGRPALSGSVAEGVLRRAACPVLTLRLPARSETAV